MLQTADILISGLELDKAFEYAVILAWQNLSEPIEPRSLRVEYLCEPGTALDHLSVWSVRAGGYQDLVCDYWTGTSQANQPGARFENGYCSAKMALTLDFIMKHQRHFTRLADADRHGLVQIYPPNADNRREASAWIKTMERTGSEWDAGKEGELIEFEGHSQDEEALSRMDDGYSCERDAALPDATGYSDYEWSPA